MNFGYKVLGFIVGVIAAVAVEFALIAVLNTVFNLNLLPRGLGWIAVPVLSGIALAGAAPGIVARLQSGSVKKAYWQTSIGSRFFLIAGILWLLSVPMFVFLFNPYGHYMSSSSYTHMTKVMLFPVAIMFVAYLAFSKLVRGKDESST